MIVATPTSAPTPLLYLPSAEPRELKEPAETEIDETTNANKDSLPEKIMSATETSSRVHEPSTYEEAITDPIHSRQWKEA